MLSAVLRGAEHALESVGGESPTLINLGGQAETHPLGDTFYSATPYLYGEYVAKVCVAPVSPELTALTKKPVDLKDKPDGLREAVNAYFAGHGGGMGAARATLQRPRGYAHRGFNSGLAGGPEPLRRSCAHHRPPQTGWSEARSRAVDDGMAFSPWHGLAAHRPLGSINRLRRLAYEKARQFRASRNGQAIAEPHSLDDFPA